MVIVYFSFAQNIIHHNGKGILKKHSRTIEPSYSKAESWNEPEPIFIFPIAFQTMFVFEGMVKEMFSLNSDLKQDAIWRICQKGCKKNESKNICFVESQCTSYCMKTILQSYTQKLLKI